MASRDQKTIWEPAIAHAVGRSLEAPSRAETLSDAAVEAAHVLEDLRALRPTSYALMMRMARTQLAKAHDYAGADRDPLANFREAELLGIPAWKGCLLRMGDKWSRLRNFCRVGKLKVSDESFVDTVLDLAVYALILVELFQQEEG